jgi:hypothetical protein
MRNSSVIYITCLSLYIQPYADTSCSSLFFQLNLLNNIQLKSQHFLILMVYHESTGSIHGLFTLQSTVADAFGIFSREYDLTTWYKQFCI